MAQVCPLSLTVLVCLRKFTHALIGKHYHNMLVSLLTPFAMNF